MNPNDARPLLHARRIIDRRRPVDGPTPAPLDVARAALQRTRSPQHLYVVAGAPRRQSGA